MVAMTNVPIDCWMCREQYHVPAYLSLVPPSDPIWYSEPVSANVWAWVDRRPIAEHLAAHWPMILFCYFWWQARTEIMGVDVLEPYWRRA